MSGPINELRENELINEVEVNPVYLLYYHVYNINMYIYFNYLNNFILVHILAFTPFSVLSYHALYHIIYCRF